MDIEVLGKNVCRLAGVDAKRAVVVSQASAGARTIGFLEDLSPCVVAMEACGGAHHIGRFCRVRLGMNLD